MYLDRRGYDVLEVSVCNTKLDWGSIVSGATKLKVDADFQVGGIWSAPTGEPCT
jgi:hypothetical protein